MTSISDTETRRASMKMSFAKYAVAATTLVAGGGLGAVAAQAPAYAGGFSTTYTCDVPMLGSSTLALAGWLTSPGQAAVSRPTGFQLHISSLNFSAPVPIDSWNASAWITVGGSENAAFRVAGSGGYVPPGQPLTGDLAGEWAPTTTGTHLLSVGRLRITASTAATGMVTARCTPTEPRPVAETMTVLPSYEPGWSGPIVPPYAGWTPPVVYRPGWHRPPIVVVPPRHIGWTRPPYHGGWNRPGHHPHGH
jgi:hypothetical protein